MSQCANCSQLIFYFLQLNICKCPSTFCFCKCLFSNKCCELVCSRMIEPLSLIQGCLPPRFSPPLVIGFSGRRQTVLQRSNMVLIGQISWSRAQGIKADRFPALSASWGDPRRRHSPALLQERGTCVMEELLCHLIQKSEGCGVAEELFERRGDLIGMSFS